MRRTIRGKASIRSVSIMRLRTDTSHPLPPALRLLLDDIDDPADQVWQHRDPADFLQMTETVTGFRTLAARRTAPAMFCSMRVPSPPTRDYALSVATADRR